MYSKSATHDQFERSKMKKYFRKLLKILMDNMIFFKLPLI